MPTLGIDVGASKVRYVIWEKNQVFLNEEVKLLAPSREELNRIFQEISKITKERRVSAVGVGLPGTVENESVTSALNFPTLAGWNIKAELEKLLGVPVKIVNDAKAFVIAETQAGAAKGKQNVIGITLGSGLGIGIVLNGNLYLGQGTAGEEGHEIIDLPNRKEAEDFASAKFFKKFGKSPNQLRQLAEVGDRDAKQAFEEFGKNLGVIIANLVNLLDPEEIVLGGGITGAYDFFIEETKKTAADLIVNPSRKNIEILPAALGPSAGAIGAAILAGL
jgi:glucokinase